MLKNYFKITWRILIRNKVYSVINISGLSLSMICSMLIILWVADEQNYETFFPESDQIYRMYQEQSTENGDVFKVAAAPAPMPQFITEKFPEIETFTRVRPNNEDKDLLEYQDVKIYEQITFVDSTFFDVFQLEFLEGNPKHAISGTNTLVITERVAEKFFGENWKQEGVLGKEIIRKTKYNFTITGVIKNLPSNSHFHFDVLMPFKILYVENWGMDWYNNYFYSYYKLAEGTDVQALSAKVSAYAETDDRIADKFIFQALEDIHLYSDFDIDLYGSTELKYPYVNIFLIIALSVIVIACINFMNLSTARAEKRAKEIGLRKSIGARRINIIYQLMSESMFFVFASFAIAIVGVLIILPFFNNIVGKNMSLTFADWQLIGSFLIGTVMVGFLAGSYPAFYLSAFQPIKVLKGTITSSRSGALFRKVLVTIQFSVALVMVVGTMIIYHQFQFFMNKDLGYDKDLMIYLPRRGEVYKNHENFKSALRENPLIKNVSSSSDLPTYTVHSFGGFDWPGKNPDELVRFHGFSVGYDYVETLGLTLKEGREFSQDFPTDIDNYMLNEAALKITGLENPIGERFSMWGQEGRIIGIVKDFNFKSLHQSVEPLVLAFDAGWDKYYFVKISPDNIDGAIAAIGDVWEKFNPDYPFEYHFLDEEYENLYVAEKRMSEVFNYFTFFTIFITCLGLFGLITYMAEKKKKEIGIRKVLGASISSILLLLSKEFLVLIMIALFVGIPVSNYFLTEWLNGFAYRISLEWWLFLIPGVIILFITMFAVSSQSLKAAMTNPTESLRNQ